MRLFESQEARNKRLFQSGLTGMAQRAEAVIEPPGLHIVNAWLLGGSLAAGAVVNLCNYIKSAWGKGNEEKTLALTEVFSLAMISWWYWDVGKKLQMAEAERRNRAEESASILLHLFGHPSDAAPEDFINMDLQFRYDMENEVGLAFYYVPLLLARAREACGQRCIEWGNVAFPVTSMAKLREGGAILGQLSGPEDSLAAHISITTSVHEMFAYYNARTSGE